MPLEIDPTRFAGKKMALRHTWPNTPHDYVAVVDGLRAGRIMQVQRSFQRVVWFWSLSAPYTDDRSIRMNGECDTLTEAKAAFRKSFDRWVAWRKGQQRTATWYS